MSHDIETPRDESTDLAVYLGLLVLTGLTLAASFLGRGRAVAVSVAFAIASAKASLIGLYFMGLRKERPLIFVMLGVGVLAVLILLVGIIPDVAYRW